MNAIKGEILFSFESGEISAVNVSTALADLSVFMLGFSQSLNAQKGTKVELLFKENELLLAKTGEQAALISCGNVFAGVVASIDKGELLWQVFVKGLSHGTLKAVSFSGEHTALKDGWQKSLCAQDVDLSALMSAQDGERLNLQPNDKVFCLVNPCDIIIRVL